MLILGHHQYILNIFHTATLHVGILQDVMVPGIVPPQVQDFTLSLVELLEIPFSSFLQLMNISLDGSITLVSAASPGFVSLLNFMRVCSVRVCSAPSPRSLVKMLNDI